MNHPLENPTTSGLKEYSTLELAQALAERLAISDRDWHRLKSNPQVRACEHITAALIFLLKEQPTETLGHLEQAQGWLDHSIKAPPCPTHGR
ncbi:MAG: DUF6439 family protein [Microcoleaceae cyanobacterium]